MQPINLHTKPHRKIFWGIPVVAVVLFAVTAAVIGFKLTPLVLAGESSKGALPPGVITKEPAKSFTEHVAKINASPEFFAALAKQPDKNSVINLNLLRYRPRGDSTTYDKYGAVAGPEILAIGGDIVLHGHLDTKANKVFEFDDTWDGLAFVLYPRRSSYLQLQRSEAYQAGITDRVAGTYERLLYVISDGEAIFDASYSIDGLHKGGKRIAFKEGNVFVSQLLRFKKPDGRKSYERFAKEFSKIIKKHGGEAILSVRAEMPIVTEEYWDHFVTFRYPSKEALKKMYDSDEFHEANLHRINALDGTISVLAEPTPLPE
ncbi:MAG: DUF1330 domain-containing protein [Desulfosarcina sp.]|nr:DUF1330 domain-containing protein [Desulfobacterales bacterium]